MEIMGKRSSLGSEKFCHIVKCRLKIKCILSLTVVKFWIYTTNVYEKSKNDPTLYICGCLEIFGAYVMLEAL